MRFACLIVTYTSPRLTKRIIDKLNNGDFDFYIHLDKKVDMETHRELFDIPNVYFIKKRVDIKWAGFSTVVASFNGIQQIAETGIEYGSISLFSGQDYPIKSAAYISNFLKEHAGKQLVNHWDFETQWTEAFERINKYHFTDVVFKGRYLVQSLLNRVIKKRWVPEDLKFYGTNSMFWTLTLECALYVMNYVENNSRLKRFLKYTWGSDEFIFPTVIMNSPFKDTLINNNFRYVDWSAGGARPKTLLTEDYDKIVQSGKIIARKFDIDADENILDMIDKENGI